MSERPRSVEDAIAAGYSVVPASADKVPAIAGRDKGGTGWKPWQTRRQTEEEQAALGHGSIWGLVTGALYGITVLDFDGEEGLATMRLLGLAPHVKTPGGYHVYVKHPGHPVKNSARKFEQYPGLDVRGDGGLAWFAGRSKKGPYRVYRWPPEPIELPEALAEELFPHPQDEAERAPRADYVGQGDGAAPELRYLAYAADKVRRAPEGRSNAVLNKVAFGIGGLVAAGRLDPVFAYDTLVAAAEERGAGDPHGVISSSFESGAEKPWRLPDDEAVAMADDEWVSSAVYKVFGQAAVPEPTPFPVEVFPAPLDDFIKQGAESLSCPPDYLGAGLLPVMGVGIGGYVDLQLTETWRESALVYTALVGEPGDRKTPAMNLLMAPVWDAEQAMFDSYDQQREADEEAWRQIKPPRLTADDATMEAIFGLLEQNERGIIVASDELSGWVGGMGQYKGGLGRDRQHWLSIWSRRPLPVDRKKSTSHFIRKPFAVVFGGIQPEPLEGLIQGKDDGLIPRLLMARGPKVTPEFRLGVMDPRVIEGYHDLWNRVRDEGLVQRTVQFTPDGIRAYELWVNEHYKTLQRTPPELAGAWAKMDGQAGRIALILSRLHDREVDADIVDRAVALVRYFQGQAGGILQSAQTGSSWEKQHAARTRVVAQFLAAHPGASKGDIMAGLGVEWALDSRTLDRILEPLKALGLWVG